MWPSLHRHRAAKLMASQWATGGVRRSPLGPPVGLPIGAVSGAQISHDEDDEKMRGTVARIMIIEEGAKD